MRLELNDAAIYLIQIHGVIEGSRKPWNWKVGICLKLQLWVLILHAISVSANSMAECLH